MGSRVVQAELGDLVLASTPPTPPSCASLASLIEWVNRLHTEGRSLILCGNINIARTERDVHPRERKPASAAGRMRLQHTRLEGDRGALAKLRGTRRRRHERPCAGDDDHQVGLVARLAIVESDAVLENVQLAIDASTTAPSSDWFSAAELLI
jgi:hypothetical protein